MLYFFINSGKHITLEGLITVLNDEQLSAQSSLLGHNVNKSIPFALALAKLIALTISIVYHESWACGI